MDVRRCLLLAVAGVLSWVLVGCADEEPQAGPSSSSPTETTSSPTETVSPTPTVPADETAEEFIRRWFATQQRMYDTGETSEYLGMAPGCESCVQAADRIKGIYDAGGSIRYDGDKVTSVKPLNADKRLYEVRLRIGATVYREGPGAPEKRLAGGAESYSVALERVEGQWRVSSALRNVS